MFRSSARSKHEFPLTAGFLFLTSSAVGVAGVAAAVPSQLDNSAPAACQAEELDEADAKAGQTGEGATGQGAAEEEDNDFFLWLDNAFSTSAGGQTKKPGASAREGNDRDHGGKDHGGGGGGGNGGGGGH